jgi:hypothetical protein
VSEEDRGRYRQTNSMNAAAPHFARNSFSSLLAWRIASRTSEWPTSRSRPEVNAPYFIAHAKAVSFELNADIDMHRARRASAWLRREQKARFSRRDLHKAIANNDAAQVLDRPLAILEERGFVRPAPKQSGHAGRPSLEFLVNPQVLKHE